MRLKITIALLIVLLGLLVYIFYIDPWEQDDKAKPSNNPLGPYATELGFLEITNNATQAVTRLDQERQSWFITQPYRWPANGFAVERMLTQLRFLDKKVSFEVDSLDQAGTTLADYGLDPPDLTLSFGSGSQSYSVGIGRATDIGERLYMLSLDGNYIHVVARSLLDSLSISLDELRDPRAFTSEIFEVDSWNITVSEGSASGARARFTRMGDDWIFETPIRTWADAPVVNTLLGRVLQSQAIAILPDATNLESLGLHVPSYRIAIESDQQREVLEIGGSVAEGIHQGLRYAKLQGRPTLFLVNFEFEEALAQAQTLLRNRRIFSLDTRKATSLAIKEADKEPLTLQKLENGEWKLLNSDKGEGITSLPGDAIAIEQLLERLYYLTSVPESGFINDAPSAAELERYGLEAPQMSISLTSSVSRFHPGELPAAETETLYIGDRNFENRLERFVKQADTNFVYSIYGDAMERIGDNPLFFINRDLLKLSEDAKIVSMSLTRLGSENGDDQQELDIATDPQAQALATEIRNLRAHAFVANSLSSNATIAGQAEPWAYRLELSYSLGNGQDESAQAFELLISELTGGPLLLGGAIQAEKTFRFEQGFIDAFTPIAFSRRPQPIPEEPFAAEQPAPEANLENAAPEENAETP